MRYIKNKNPRNVMGFTPLHLAAQNGQMKVVQLILVNVEIKNPKAEEFLDWTPLHLAAQHGHYHICKLLMGSISEKNPRNKCGQTPKSLAIENNHQGIAMLIDEMSRPVASKGAGGAHAPSVFGRPVNPISTRGAHYPT